MLSPSCTAASASSAPTSAESGVDAVGNRERLVARLIGDDAVAELYRERHVRALAEKLGVGTRFLPYRDPHTSYSHARSITVGTQGGWTLQTYLVALHELGHCAHPEHFTEPVRWLLEFEGQAWVWALEHSREPAGRVARELITRCLEGHIACGTRGSGPTFQRLVREVCPHLTERGLR
jgi:hypothetical protein